MYLLKHETTWSDLQRPEKTWSNLKRTRNYLKRPTANKKQPKTTYSNLKQLTAIEKRPTSTWNYLQRAKRDLKRSATSRFWDYFTIWGNHVFHSTFDCNYSCIPSWRIITEIERQTFIYYPLHLLRDIKFAGYISNHLDTCKLTFAKSQKPV